MGLAMRHCSKPVTPILDLAPHSTVIKVALSSVRELSCGFNAMEGPHPPVASVRAPSPWAMPTPEVLISACAAAQADIKTSGVGIAHGDGARTEATGGCGPSIALNPQDSSLTDDSATFITVECGAKSKIGVTGFEQCRIASPIVV